jgi:hypothetical protein
VTVSTIDVIAVGVTGREMLTHSTV